MLIHIETKRRWNITISTPRHNLVDTRTGPGASPCACSHSTFATPVGNDKDSPVPSYPKGPAREESTSGDSAAILRCRNFLRKICRLSVRIHRMGPRTCAALVHHETPLLYRHDQSHELSASSIYELSDGHIPGRELQGYPELAELDSHVDRTNDNRFGFGTNQAPYPDPGEINERGVAAVLSPTTSAETPMPLWSLNTQHDSASAPSMTSDGQSHDPSISPVTPTGDENYPAQHSSYDNEAASIVSPVESILAYNSRWTTPQLVDTNCGYPVTSWQASPVESFQDFSQQPHAECLDVRRNGYPPSGMPFVSPSLESFVPGDYLPLASDNPLPEPRAQWPNTEAIRLGVGEHREQLGWEHHGRYGQVVNEVENATTLDQSRPSPYTHHFNDSQRSSRNYIELSDHQDPESWVPLEANKIEYPLEQCAQCGRTFSGKYRKGNMRRHVIAFHSPLAVVVGKACRICKKVYNRADATRLHEWKIHRLSEVKPKKRTKQ